VSEEDRAEALRKLIIDSFTAMLFLGIRMNMGKYLARILSPLTVVKLGFLADFVCGAFVILLSAANVIQIPLSVYF